MATNPLLLDPTNPALIKRLPVPDTSGTIPTDAAPPVLPVAAPPTVVQAPNAAQNTTTRLLGDQNELKRLRDTGSGISQINNPFLRGLAHAGEIAETIFSPGAAALTPGTAMHNRFLQNQSQGDINSDLANQGSISQNQDMQAQAQQREALAQQEQAKAQSLMHPKGGLLYDKNGSPIGYQDPAGKYYAPNDPSLDPGVRDVLTAAQRKQPTNAFELWQQQNPKGTAEQYLALSKPEKDANLTQQLLDAETSGDQTRALAIRKVINETQVQPKIDIHSAEGTGGGSYSVAQLPDGKGGMKSVLLNSRTGEVKDAPEGLTKGSGGQGGTVADKNRTSLAKIAMNNLDQMQELVNRRGDMLGKVGGVFTSVDQMMGSNDPDVVALGTQMHNFAMANAGIHGSRSAQNVHAQEEQLLNHFKTGQQGFMGGINANRKNLNEVISMTEPQTQGAAPAGAATHVYNPATGKIEAVK